MGVASYIRDVTDTAKSVFEGMSITFSHLFRRPMTIQYPDKIPVPIQETLPHRYRGILEVDLDICTGCLACERVCPITCITIGIDMNKETKQRQFTHFDIDICKCMYCGLCVEACPCDDAGGDQCAQQPATPAERGTQLRRCVGCHRLLLGRARSGAYNRDPTAMGTRR